jgi:hypothetical protein
VARYKEFILKELFQFAGYRYDWFLDVNSDIASEVYYDTTLLINPCSKISLEITFSLEILDSCARI